jgi:hypothetical protein
VAAVNVFVDERTHALVVGRRLGPWRALGAAELVPLLAAPGPGNLRPARFGAELAWIASVPLPLAEEILARSRARLVEEVERAGVRMHPGVPSPARPSRAVPSTSASLALVRSVALARDWRVRGDERLELDPADAGGLVLRAAPEGGGTTIRADAGGARLAPGPGVARALAVAALGWNARLSAARLRLLDAERMEFAAECALPPDPTEDDVELALDGVLHAAREARRSLAVLAHPAVAREYAAALELPPCVEDNQGDER